MSERFAVVADIETGQERKEAPTLGHTQDIARKIAAVLAGLVLKPVPVAEGEK